MTSKKKYGSSKKLRENKYGGAGPYGNNLMGLPEPYPNMNTFPHLGAFPGEVGPGRVPGGIGGSWPFNLPLSYWWNFGSIKKISSKKRKRSLSKKRPTKRHYSNKTTKKRRSTTKNKKRRSTTKNKKRRSTTKNKKRRYSNKNKKRHSRRKSKKRPSKCKQYVSEQISKNMKLYKEGKEFSSKEQAIAVAYSQVKKNHPACKRYLKK